MEPASLFLFYVVGILGLWLMASAVRPVVLTAARVGSKLPIGRPLMALVISAALLFGTARSGPANGSVGPANQRMEQMADAVVQAPLPSPDTITRLHSMASTAHSHVVVQGESLWRIARTVLATDGSSPTGSAVSDLWRSIYELNRDLIGDDPNLIHPGQVLELPGR
jgi:nucleoid-associated protein YgaU